MQVVKEAGSNHFFDTDFASINSRACTLLLHFSEDGFSYSILENNANQVLYTAVSDAAIDLFAVSETQLLEIFHTKKVFKYTYAKVIVLLDTAFSTLVPNSFFVNDKQKEILAFNVNLPSSDLVFHTDNFSSLDYKNIYVNATSLENVLDKNFVDYEIKAAETVLLDFLDNSNEQHEYFHVHIAMKKIHCCYFKEKKLQFNNIFNYNSSEDLLYNILNTYKHLGLNTELSVLNLSGIVSEQTDLYNLLYKYIKHIKFAQKPLKLNFSARLNEMPAHYFLHHYAAFL